MKITLEEHKTVANFVIDFVCEEFWVSLNLFRQRVGILEKWRDFTQEEEGKWKQLKAVKIPCHFENILDGTWRKERKWVRKWKRTSLTFWAYKSCSYLENSSGWKDGNGDEGRFLFTLEGNKKKWNSLRSLTFRSGCCAMLRVYLQRHFLFRRRYVENCDSRVLCFSFPSSSYTTLTTCTCSSMKMFERDDGWYSYDVNHEFQKVIKVPMASNSAFSSTTLRDKRLLFSFFLFHLCAFWFHQ